MWKRFKPRRKDRLGAPLKVNHRHPKANCKVYVIRGKEREKKGPPYFWREAVLAASSLAKQIRGQNVSVIVQRKCRIIWSSDEKRFPSLKS